MDYTWKITISIDDFLLEKQKPYSRAMAWIEIIQEASLNGGKLTVPERTLAERWQQTRHWVRTLIEHLEKIGLIEVYKDSKFQSIRVVEIERYFRDSTNVNQFSTNMYTDNQSVKLCSQPMSTNSQPMSTNVNQSPTNTCIDNQSINTDTQPIVNQSSTNEDKDEIKKEELSPLKIPFKEEINKEETEEKNKRKTINGRRKEKIDVQAEKLENLKKRKDKFYDSLIPYVAKYGKEMIREFFDYWSEMNKSQTKMRFELERTWEVGRRLGTWDRNNKMSRMTNKGNNMNVGVVLHNTDEDYEKTKEKLW